MNAITAPDATLRLGQLTCTAHEAAVSLANSLLDLRWATGREDAAEIFAALTAFETAATVAREASAAVISHAVSDHGYF